MAQTNGITMVAMDRQLQYGRCRSTVGRSAQTIPCTAVTLSVQLREWVKAVLARHTRRMQLRLSLLGPAHVSLKKMMMMMKMAVRWYSVAVFTRQRAMWSSVCSQLAGWLERNALAALTPHQRDHGESDGVGESASEMSSCRSRPFDQE